MQFSKNISSLQSLFLSLPLHGIDCFDTCKYRKNSILRLKPFHPIPIDVRKYHTLQILSLISETDEKYELVQTIFKNK